MEAAQRRIQITARHIEPQEAAAAVDALHLADVAAEAAGFDVAAMSKLLVCVLIFILLLISTRLPIIASTAKN